MTELLYMRDNYLREFSAQVTSIGDNYIVLDRTAFYPEGGGQISDKGQLTNGEIAIQVKEVKKHGLEVQHKIAGSVPFTQGTELQGILDWEHRYECMRFHTAQHVLSRYLQLNYGLETVGNMVKPGSSRADYAPLNEFSEAMKIDVENGVNEILRQNIKVETQFMPRSEAIRFLNERGYQTRYLEMVPKSVTEFRVLIIGNYDAASCAGTHVRNTREVGEIKIEKDKNVGAGKRRIYFMLQR